MTCEIFVVQLSELLDGDLDATQAAALRDHALGCRSCHALHSSSRQMLGMLQNPDFFAMPSEARKRLHAGLAAGLGEPLVPHALRPAAVPPPPRPSGFAARFSHWLSPLRSPAWAAVAVLVLLAVGVVRWRASATTAAGWLIDRHCLAAFAGHPADHDRDCLLRCAASQYGLVDAKGNFIAFDAKGNSSALAAVRATSQPDHLWVKVRGRSAPNQTIQVQQLELTEPADK